MTFYKFMERYLKQDNAFGDLANDMYEDYLFPKNAKKKEILKHFDFNSAINEVYTTFEKAYKEYIKQS